MNKQTLEFKTHKLKILQQEVKNDKRPTCGSRHELQTLTDARIVLRSQLSPIKEGKVHQSVTESIVLSKSIIRFQWQAQEKASAT